MMTTIVFTAASAAGYGTRALYSRYRRRRWRRAQEQALEEKEHRRLELRPAAAARAVPFDG